MSTELLREGDFSAWETYLYMAHRVLACNGNSILGANDSHFTEDGVSNRLLNGLDLLNGLLMRKAVKEKINIGGRAELFVVVLAKLSLIDIELLRDRQESVDNGRTGSDNVVPVQLGKRRLGEDCKVFLKLADAVDGGGRPIGTTLLVWECHDVLGLFLF